MCGLGVAVCRLVSGLGVGVCRLVSGLGVEVGSVSWCVVEV